MADKSYTLNGEKRDVLGKEFSSELRTGDKMPAVIYGPDLKDNVNITIDYREFDKVFSQVGKHHILEISVDGKKYKTIVKDYKIHPISRMFLHVDFYAVSAKKPFITEVPLKYVGTPTGVKEGGNLFAFTKKVKIKTTVANLPESIDVDVSKLHRKQYMIVRQIETNDKFKIITHEGNVLVEIK